jgi:Membrane protease subunits, stomatin/prohibitin homologs
MSFFGEYVKGSYGAGTEFRPKVGRIVGAALALLIAPFILFGTWYTVDAGSRAVVLRFSGINRTAGPGLHMKLPLVESVVHVSTRIQKTTAESTASSKDLQVVHTKIAVNYSVAGEDAADIYRQFGYEWEQKFIDPTINETFKSVTAKFTAEELITKRHEASTLIEADLKTRLKPFGFSVENIAITNFDFSAEFNSAIEAKQTAEQLALKAERDLDRIKTEAEQKVASAQAEAESLRLQKAQITAEMLQLRAIEKWDGVMPQIVGGNGAVPFINVNTKKKGGE